MATSDRRPVESARSNLEAARRVLVDELFAFEQATTVLTDAQRSLAAGTDELADAQAAFEAASVALQGARSAEAERFSQLQSALATWLPDGVSEEEDISRLEATSPIVLFPVRIETRFDGARLKLRVFPDEIFLNTHERALTQPEYDAAKSYYKKLNSGTSERELWRDIVKRFGVPRSAFILRQMLPTFGAEGLNQSSTYSLSSSFCGGTIVGGRDEELFFPDDVQLRSASWTRPGEAMLPDRWVVILYGSNGTSRTVRGSRIIEPLAMTPDPNLEESDLVVVHGGYKIDDHILWTVDFERAVASGMALDIGLVGNEATLGFERIVVVGVKSSLSADDSSRRLEQLMDAHHYTRGLALLPQGAPTNNMEGEPTGFPVEDNAGQFSFGIERQNAPLDRAFSHHCLPFGTDGLALATVLGLPSGVFANVDRAYKFEIDHARSMNEALWPGTIGYFMQHMMSPIFGPERIADAKDYFRSFVLGRGPAPAFRIGATPYGVLPIGSLRLWQPRSFGQGDDFASARDDRMAALEANMLAPLQRLFEVWLEGVGNVPIIRAGRANPDVDVATVLSLTPSSREFRIRYGFSESVQWSFWDFFGWYSGDLFSALDQQSQDTFGLLGFPNWRTPLGRTAFERRQFLFTGDVVAPTLSESVGLPGPNFITNLTAVSAEQLNSGNVPGRPSTPNLLYTMLRHSTLVEYARLVAESIKSPWVEYQIFGIPSLAGTVQHILPIVLNTATGSLQQLANAHRNALLTIANESTAELERLFTESLDLASHRLDAWVTAFAYRRIDDMRRAQLAAKLIPKGDFLGGYGWLENVRPASHPQKVVPGVGTFEIQLQNGGFIHTPSMSHAAAAAVLRNGHLSVKGENAAAYAVDLSSRRVRAGRRLFEGVRNGQPVGALLGYDFERALHEGYPSVPGLDVLRFLLRGRFPLVANKSGTDPGTTAESIAARNVVDGSLLLRAYKSHQLSFGTGGLPAPGTAQHSALVTELDKLAEAYDAAADLLTAEGVFQMVRGNIDAAVPTMNNVVEGDQPPDTIISRSARGGIGISHRVVLLFPADAGPSLPGGWPATATPRAQAEPVLNAWIGELVGNPAEVRATLTYLDAEGIVIPSTHLEGGTSVVQSSVEIELGELALHPLDVLALAEAIAQENQGSTLDRRLIAVALADPNRKPDATPARFALDYTTQSGRSFPEVLEVLNTAGMVLRASRPLELKDLLPPAESTQGVNEPDAEPVGGVNARAFYMRGQAARGALESAIGSLTSAMGASSGVRDALISAAYIAPMSSFPDATVPEDSLAESAKALLKELTRRLDRLPAPIEPAAAVATTPSDTLLAHGRDSLRGVFGDSFVALPDVAPPRAPEIQLSLAARSTLLGSDEAAPDRYVQQISHQRDRLSRFRKLNLYARASGLPRARVDVLQLPHVPGERWLGLPFDPNTPPEPGRAAVLLLNYAASLNPTVEWRGLVVDDWIEIIPKARETTGIACHYDTPDAEAPQAILVAAPSQSSAQWTFAELRASLEQTMDLMKIRGVSQEDLDQAQLFPMTITPSNESILTTIATLFGDLRVGTDTSGLS